MATRHWVRSVINFGFETGQEDALSGYFEIGNGGTLGNEGVTIVRQLLDLTFALSITGDPGELNSFDWWPACSLMVGVGVGAYGDDTPLQLQGDPDDKRITGTAMLYPVTPFPSQNASTWLGVYNMIQPLDSKGMRKSSIPGEPALPLVSGYFLSVLESITPEMSWLMTGQGYWRYLVETP